MWRVKGACINSNRGRTGTLGLYRKAWGLNNLDALFSTRCMYIRCGRAEQLTEHLTDQLDLLASTIPEVVFIGIIHGQ